MSAYPQLCNNMNVQYICLPKNKIFNIYDHYVITTHPIFAFRDCINGHYNFNELLVHFLSNAWFVEIITRKIYVFVF